jgi:hypothetical protein
MITAVLQTWETQLSMSVLPIFENRNHSKGHVDTYAEFMLTSERHLHPKSLSWCKFHGPRKPSVQELGIFDIVITTYKVGVLQPISFSSRLSKVLRDMINLLEYAHVS